MKSSDTETEGEILVAHIQQSPDAIAAGPQQSLQISIPQGLSVQLPQSVESTAAAIHEINVERMEIDAADTTTVSAEIRLGSISSPPGVHEGEGVLGKGGLSPYMEHQCSPEQEEGNSDSYPESTINLQDLR